MKQLCSYAEVDTTAAMAQNEDGSWFSRCHCGTVVCESGTYAEAQAALETHREPA